MEGLIHHCCHSKRFAGADLILEIISLIIIVIIVSFSEDEWSWVRLAGLEYFEHTVEKASITAHGLSEIHGAILNCNINFILINWINQPFLGPPGYQISENTSVWFLESAQDSSFHQLHIYECDPTKNQNHFIAVEACSVPLDSP